MITLLNKEKNLNPLFQTGDVVYGEGKLRDLGMVFKPSFKCLKNKKINFIPAILKLETLLYQNIYICSDQSWNLNNLKIFFEQS